MRAAVASIADVGLVGVDTHRRRGPNQASRRVWCPSVPRKRESCRVMRRPRAIEKQAPVLFDFAYLTTTPGDEPVLAETATPPWICLLRDTSFRKGGTARCARNGKPPAGVTPVPQCWKTLRHDAISGAVAMSTKQNNTSEHVRVDANTKHTTKTHPVLVALARRVRDNTKPGSRHDGMKIGLAVEGGGMKGVISAGALGGLLELGLYDAFDAVYGSSAGAMNLTYFLAKQPEGVDCYEDDLVDGRFLDVRRLPTTKTQRRLVGSKYGRAPAMDVNFLVDAVMDAGQTGRGLDFQAVIASPLTFQIVATSLDTLTPVMLGSPFHSKFDLKRSLKASAAVPLFAGPRPVKHRGQRLVDAAVMEPVPVFAAGADGCTHVLVLLTRVLEETEEEKFGTGGAARDGAREETAGKTPGSDGVVDKSAFGAKARKTHPEEERVKKEEAKPGEKRFSKTFGALVQRAVRGALLSPRHMRDAWETHDAMRAGRVPLDESLLSAKNHPEIESNFPNQPFVYSVSPTKKSLPKKGVGSLCVTPEVLKMGKHAGRDAVFQSLGHLAHLRDDELV